MLTYNYTKRRVKHFIFFFFFINKLIFSQEVYLNKVEKLHKNSDKFLYHIDKISEESIYLGEAEIRTPKSDIILTFQNLYKQAKDLGANSYSIVYKESLTEDKYVPDDYVKLKLFYTPNESLKNQNSINIVTFSDKKLKIKINNRKYLFDNNYVVVVKPKFGEVFEISTGSILGSRIRVKTQENQPNLFFNILGFNINSRNSKLEEGLNFKTGDIVQVDESLGRFIVLFKKPIFVSIN